MFQPYQFITVSQIISHTLFQGVIIYIYIYAFSRRFYQFRLYIYLFFVSMCHVFLWELNPQPFALLTQCSSTEPQEHCVSYTVINYLINLVVAGVLKLNKMYLPCN